MRIIYLIYVQYTTLDKLSQSYTKACMFCKQESLCGVERLKQKIVTKRKESIQKTYHVRQWGPTLTVA